MFIGYGQRHLPTKILGQQLEQDMTLVGLGSTGPGSPDQLREPGSQGREMRLPQGWHTTSVSHPYKSSVRPHQSPKKANAALPPDKLRGF